MELHLYLQKFIFGLICFCLLISFINGTVSANSGSSPDIEITIHGVNNSNISLVSFQNDSHIVISRNINDILLNCKASHPVTWSLEEFDQPWTTQRRYERYVGNFYDSSTYTFSTTIKLSKFGLTNNVPEMYLCLDPDFSNHNRTSNIIIVWEGNNPKDYKKCYGEVIECWNETSDYISRHKIIRSSYFSRNDSYYWARCDILSNTLHHYLSQLLPTNNTTHLGSLNKYICHQNRSRENSYYFGYFDIYKNYDSLIADLEGNSSIEFKYKSLNDINKNFVWSSVISNDDNATLFYVGDIVVIHCKFHQAHYAFGILWEIEWQNGTKQIQSSNDLFSNSGYYTAQYSVELANDQLKMISCHTPLWNSTRWLTSSLRFNLKASVGPASKAGKSILFENVTFYTYQRVTVSCDFDGHPFPKFSWHNLSSEAYDIQNQKNNRSQSGFEATSTTVISDNRSWMYHSNDSSEYPKHEISCTARNLAGNATKVFRIQAIRSFPPVLSHKPRELIVLPLHNAAKINCSFIKCIPAPEFYWQKNGRNMSMNGNYEIINQDNESLLVFNHVSYEDEGEYTCTVTNFRGSESKQYSVRVRDVSAHFMYDFAIATLSFTLVAIMMSLIYAYMKYTRKIKMLEGRAVYFRRINGSESTITTLLD